MRALAGAADRGRRHDGPVTSRILDRADLDFLLHEWLRVGDLLERPAFAEHDRDTFDAVLELAEQIATERFAPHNRAADVAEPHVDRRQGGRSSTGSPRRSRRSPRPGFVGASVPVEQGGMRLPFTVARAALAWFQAANIGTASYPFLTTAAANLLLAHGTPEQIEAWVPPMLDGPLLRDDVPLRAAGRLVAGRHHHPRRAAGRRHLPAHRHQDVDLRRRARADREHRPPGARQDPRRPARGEGHLAVRRARATSTTAPAQRRRPRRAEPQDGLPRHRQHPAELRRGRSRDGRLRRGRLAGRRGARRPRLRCST